MPWVNCLSPTRSQLAKLSIQVTRRLGSLPFTHPFLTQQDRFFLALSDDKAAIVEAWGVFSWQGGMQVWRRENEVGSEGDADDGLLPSRSLRGLSEA